MTKELFIPYEQALALKQLEFDEPCFGLFVRMNNKLLIKEVPNQQESEQYFGGILAPTYSQAFRFFREKYNIDAWVQPFMMGKLGPYLPDESYVYWIFKDGDFVADKVDFLDFEEAELECLKKIIEIVKK